ncbi:hypothetical protein GH714_000123 [Hevea brasiliensis]|uniref:RRM domain-containing protein n=1 Tax=Hevea brasiliensis TaxID=3981 RepID=A0A6A6L848_HEVBR|nr:hypothetical protein GH714_000123 [Hevea brasiliensis]
MSIPMIHLHTGMDYFLCDCVYFRNDDVETYIGKLVKIFETPKHEKKVKVEVIVEKCNVVCASDDKRNPQATEQELRMADYIFYHSFDVGEHRILKNFANYIDGNKVEHFFNGLKDQNIIAPPILEQNVKADGLTVRDGKSSSSCPVVKETKKVAAGLGEQEHISNDTGTSKIPCSQVNDKAKKVRASADSPTADASRKKRKLLQEKEGAVSRKVGPQVALDGGVKTASKISSRPDAGESLRLNLKSSQKWALWALMTAEEAGTLVLLENLDPSFTSSEVEDLVWHALNQRVDAKVIQNSTFLSPYYGKVLVIFKSKVAAESAISKLQKRCLMLGDGRRGSLRDHGNHANFIGHLSVLKFKLRQSEEMRKAVSTAHFSQSNTVEYDMAMEWRMLQEKCDMCWKKLHMVLYIIQFSLFIMFILTYKHVCVRMHKCVHVGAYARETTYS